MRVERNGKELYHIQNMNMGSDDYPLDIFIWCDHFPNSADLKTAYLKEFKGTNFETDTDMLNDFLTTSEVYCVWTEEI